MAAVHEESWLKYDELHFCELSIRRQFVKKVFFLVTAMLCIVTFMAALPFMIPSFGTWLSGGPDGTDSSSMWLLISAIIVFLVIAIVLACVPRLTRMVPYNLILLVIFAISAGAMTMCLTAFLTAPSVLLCFAMTAGICASVIIFSIFINKDLTSMIGVMFLFGFWLFFFGITASIAVWACGVYWLNTLYSAIACVFFMLWLAIDVQLLMGNRKFAISPEEYVFAAMQIFLDILNILFIILAIFGKVK